MTERKRSRKPSPRPKLRAECFLLCDHARVQSGKIDILGGGWDRIQPASFPASHRFALAIKLGAPTALAAGEITLKIEFVSDRGDVLDFGFQDFHVRMSPRQEWDLDVANEYSLPYAIATQVTFERAGTYTIRLIGNDETLAHVNFAVDEPPSSAESSDDVKDHENPFP
ncbi:MAG: DUF6941 family protein [Thermomicrobiales bacterium]